MRWISVAAAVCVLTAGVVSAQTAPTFNREMIVIDPAHGGTDGGARINDHLEEKEVTLAVAGRLRALLAARGFTVVSTREGDPGALLTNDQRAETANKARAVACLVIHASASGNGVYIGTSAIGSAMAAVPQAVPVTRAASGAVPWDLAQEAYVPQSLGLANQIGTALARAKVPLAMGRVAMRPLDNLTCPAISIELSGMRNGSDVTPVSDEEYQQRVAEAIAGALILWKNQAQQPEYVPVPRAALSGGAGN
jgi:N-acetylmuramoyl-L-alanine amidase